MFFYVEKCRNDNKLKVEERIKNIETKTELEMELILCNAVSNFYGFVDLKKSRFCIHTVYLNNLAR